MSSQPQTTLLSPEEYLAFERASETKHEYFDGEVRAMSGASFAHNTIVSNLIATFHPQLQESACRGVAADQRVRMSRTRYVYPDVVVVCGEPKLEDEHLDTLLEPTLVIEVLSSSTADYDHHGKWLQYQQVPTLQDYLLVAQDEPRVERYARQGEQWLYSVAGGLNATLHLDTIGCTLPLKDVYDRVFS